MNIYRITLSLSTLYTKFGFDQDWEVEKETPKTYKTKRVPTGEAPRFSRRKVLMKDTEMKVTTTCNGGFPATIWYTNPDDFSKAIELLKEYAKRIAEKKIKAANDLHDAFVKALANEPENPHTIK